MKVIVIGGGIGGIACGIALLKEGIEPLVLEQSAALAEVGAGLIVAPNAMKALAYLGAADHVRQNGVEMLRTVFREIDDTLVFESEPGHASDKYGEDRYAMHRADLLEGLVSQLPPEYVKLGARVVDISQTSGSVTVKLQSGEEIHADAAVGADGIRSAVRSKLFKETAPLFTGLVGWRAVVGGDKARRLPKPPQTTLWFAPGRHTGTYPLRRGELVNLFAWVPAEEVHRESWALSGDVAELKDCLRGAGPELRAILESIDEAFITPLYIRDPMPSWTVGRITLLGDAAHATTAAAGQGAAMALEDAIMLAICLKRHGASDVPAGLKDYESRRRPRTTRMQAISVSNNRSFNETDPLQIRARNGQLRGFQRLLGDTPTARLFSYDVVKAAYSSNQEESSPGLAVVPRRRPLARRASEMWRNVLTFEDSINLWQGERAAYERFFIREFPCPSDAVIEQLDCNGVSALQVGKGSGPVVLHLHGGGFCMGSARTSLEYAVRLSKALNAPVVVPDYRLAPEHAFPAALDDVIAVYRHLASQKSERIVVSGECAGGGLAISLAVALRDSGEAQPLAIHVVSPMCDLTLASAGTDDNISDSWLTTDFLARLAASYIQSGEPADPLTSPLLADLKGLPPLLIHAASDEVLAGAATKLAARARADHVEVELRLVDDTVHSFTLFDFLPEASSALDELRRFTDQRVASES